MDEKLEYFTQIIHDKIEHYFPKRAVKIHAEDKPFITGKIKNLELSSDVTDIINTSFREKRFGNIWKAYNTCPISKTNPCTVTGNIRPIAITIIFF